MKKLWTAVMILAVVNAVQAFQIRELTAQNARYVQVLYVVGQMSKDLDWVVSQLPASDGMRPSAFQQQEKEKIKP